MASREELEAMGIVGNVENETSENIGKSYTLLLITCFLCPFLGFITGCIHIDSNNKLARKCLTVGWVSLIMVAVIFGIVIAAVC